MLMNHHKNFRFTQIPGKTNEVSPKAVFWVIFDHFWSFLPDGDFFQKIWLSHTTIYGPLTPPEVSEKNNEPILRKLTDRRTNPIL